MIAPHDEETFCQEWQACFYASFMDDLLLHTDINKYLYAITNAAFYNEYEVHCLSYNGMFIAVFSWHDYTDIKDNLSKKMYGWWYFINIFKWYSWVVVSSFNW